MIDFNITKQEFTLGNNNIVLETGKLARQAHGSVIASMDDTQVLATVVAKKEPVEGQDFFPLSVDYIEKTYAARKIPGGFLKREGRPSNKEILTSRMIDRSMRPLFSDGFFNEVQILIMVLSSNADVDPDIISIIAASAALAISGVPFNGPIGAIRVGYKDSSYTINPGYADLVSSNLDMVVAGTKDAVIMVESEAKELTEDLMLGAVNFAHQEMQLIIDNIKNFAEKVAKPKWQWSNELEDKKLLTAIEEKFSDQIDKAYQITDKTSRHDNISQVKIDVIANLLNEDDGINESKINKYFKKVEKSIVRNKILNNQPRIDGRDNDTVRNLAIEVGILNNVHGSSLFTRGETQALVTTTLGPKRDAQIIENLNNKKDDYLILHYNFPPYCVGEIGRMTGVKRREIGHGYLVRRGISACLPTIEEYPYTIRVVAEVTESNGSSSMASVCGSSLALMHAGVPLKAPVAGIAMGLVKEGSDFSVLTDILGDEDHLGDMDFKVAGTTKGVTALQMDIKIEGITTEIMSTALKKAKVARMHILGEMNKIIATPNTANTNTPKTQTITIKKNKIRDVIGKGGATIKAINSVSNAVVDISDEGLVNIFANNPQDFDKALQMINEIIEEIEVNKVYNGKVLKIVDFGAFINVLPNQDGLLHISEIANERVTNISDYFKEGDNIEVKVIGFDRGKIKLSRKALLTEK